MGMYALINPDGVVVNVIVKDDDAPYPIEDKWQLVNIDGKSVGIGCTYNAGEFDCP